MMRSFTPFVVERVEDRLLMSASIQDPVVAHALSIGHYHRVEMGPRYGHGVVPKTDRHAGPSSKPSSKPSAVHHVIPPAITGLVATKLDANTIELTWAKADKSVDTIVLDYSSDGVHYATLGMLDHTETSFTASGLESGKTYSFKLFAMNKKGMSPASEIVAIVLG
jgi:hypothetical protein